MKGVFHEYWKMRPKTPVQRIDRCGRRGYREFDCHC